MLVTPWNWVEAVALMEFRQPVATISDKRAASAATHTRSAGAPLFQALTVCSETLSRISNVGKKTFLRPHNPSIRAG